MQEKAGRRGEGISLASLAVWNVATCANSVFPGDSLIQTNMYASSVGGERGRKRKRKMRTHSLERKTFTTMTCAEAEPVCI